MKIRNTAEIVKEILEQKPRARDCDFVLYGFVLNKYGYSVSIPFNELANLVKAAAVNGKPVIRGDDPVFNATPVFLPVIPVFVVTRANTGFGLAEGAAIFLPGTPIVGGLAILVHSETSVTDRITGRKRFRDFRAAWIEGDKCLALIDCFYRIVDAFHIVALVGKEGAFL